MENSVRKSICFRKKLNQFSKSILALSLCIALVFGYCYKRPVKADAAEAIPFVAGPALVYAFMSALGITASSTASNDELNQGYGDVWQRLGGDVQKQFTYLQGARGLIIHATKDALLSLMTQFAMHYPDVGLGYISNAQQMCDKLGWKIKPEGYAYSWWTNISISSFKTWHVLATGTMAAGLTFSYAGNAIKTYKNNYGNIAFDTGNPEEAVINNTPYAIIEGLYDTGKVYYYWITAEYDGIYRGFGLSAESSSTFTGQDMYIPALKSLIADGFSVMNHSLNDVIGRIGALQGVQDGINIRIGDVTGTLEKINDQIKSLTQSRLIDYDITDTKEKEANAERNKGRDTPAPPKDPKMPDLSLPKGLQKKFPFCLPWDLVACYKLFQMPAKAPVWHIPVNIDVGYIKVHQTYTYDMNSNKVMDTVLPIFKWFLNISFIAGLVLITRKIMS